ncbi:MAG: metallophosphoesterase [Candidatus Omnitrophota bacterium]
MIRRPIYFLAATFILCLLVIPLAAGEERPVVIVGDSQHDPSMHERIIERMVKENPLAAFSLGDQVEDGNEISLWETFDRNIRPLTAIAKYYPCLGNHENNSWLYFHNFSLKEDERWYTVIVNRMRFIVLDSTGQLKIDSEQYRWLEKVLTESQKEEIDFVIPLFHHPLLTTAMGILSDESNWGKAAFPLFEKYGVEVVFSGHSHCYERSLYNGIYYIVSGGGGSTLADQGRESPYLQLFAKKYHYCRLDNRDGTLAISVFDIDGALIDKIEITSRRHSGKPEEPVAVAH